MHRCACSAVSPCSVLAPATHARHAAPPAVAAEFRKRRTQSVVARASARATISLQGVFLEAAALGTLALGRIDGLRKRHEHPRLGALGVFAMDEFEFKAGSLDEFHRVSGEVAAIGQTLFKWIKATLPSLGLCIGGQTVFKEMETTTGLENSSEFSECLFNARNGAKRERAQRAVTGVVVKRDRFAMQARVLNGDGGGSNAWHGNLAGSQCRLDGVDEFDFRWVARDVEARPKSDLQDRSRQTSGHGVASLLHGGRAECLVDKAGNDVRAVETHFRDRSG